MTLIPPCEGRSEPHPRGRGHTLSHVVPPANQINIADTTLRYPPVIVIVNPTIPNSTLKQPQQTYSFIAFAFYSSGFTTLPNDSAIARSLSLSYAPPTTTKSSQGTSAPKQKVPITATFQSNNNRGSLPPLFKVTNLVLHHPFSNFITPPPPPPPAATAPSSVLYSSAKKSILLHPSPNNTIHEGTTPHHITDIASLAPKIQH